MADTETATKASLPSSLLWGVGLVYCAASVFFWRFPSLLHKKKKYTFDALHISHRGGAGEHIENTLNAFRKSRKEHKTEMFEIDVHLTSDHEVVIVHDSHLGRLTGVDKHVHEFQYHELPKLKTSLALFFQPYSSIEIDQQESIPKLEHLFEEFPEVPVNIDVKVDNDVLIKKVCELIAKYDRKEITVVGSSKQQVRKKLSASGVVEHSLFSSKDFYSMLFLFYVGLLPFVGLDDDLTFVEIPLPAIFVHGDSPLWWRFFAWLADRFLLNPLFVSHLHRRGFRLYLWTLNEEYHYERAMEIGVDGIMTDFPEKLRKFLDERETRVASKKKNS